MKAAVTLSVTLAALLTATGATAQWTPAVEARVSREYQACQRAADRAPTNSTGYIDDAADCTDAEMSRQDARLNQAYRMVMNRLAPARKLELRNLQRRWIVDRDRTCDATYREAGGGTANYLDMRQCRLSRTIARTIWLERYR